MRAFRSGLTSAIVSSCLMAVGASAQQGPPTEREETKITPYVTAGLAIAEIDLRNEYAYRAATLRAGIEIGHILGLEAEGTIGLNTVDFLTDNMNPRSRSLENQFGVYATAGVPIGDSFKIFARLGFAGWTDEVIGTRSDVPFTEKTTFTGVGFGLGAQYMFGDDRKNGLRLDATGILSNEEDDRDPFDSLFLDGASMFSAAYVRKF